MLELTDAAKAELINYFKDNPASPVRIFLAPGGCSGPRLALALDEAGENDTVAEFGDGITLIMNQDLLEEAKPVKVDIGYAGFTVESSMEFAPSEGQGGCGSCCGSCGSC
ncbi:IscA/HesB family protein [Desulfocurvus sp. DL9XJH121]